MLAQHPRALPNHFAWLNDMRHRPQVNWTGRDLDDNAPVVSAVTVLRDYARDGLPAPRVCRAWLPLVLISEQLWEERDALSYDWTTYHQAGVFPPLKVEIFEMESGLPIAIEQGTSGSVFYLRDGNHRARFWKDSGFSEAPAWVLDYRPAPLKR